MADSLHGFENMYLISQFSLSTLDLMLKAEIDNILYRFTFNLSVFHIKVTLLNQSFWS